MGLHSRYPRRPRPPSRTRHDPAHARSDIEENFSATLRLLRQVLAAAADDPKKITRASVAECRKTLSSEADDEDDATDSTPLDDGFDWPGNED